MDPGSETNVKIMFSASIDPLGEVIAALQFCRHLRWRHGCKFGQILGVFPLKELDPILRVRLASEVTVGRCLLILGFAEGQRLRNGTWPAIKGDLDNVGDVICCELALLCSIG